MAIVIDSVRNHLRPRSPCNNMNFLKLTYEIFGNGLMATIYGFSFKITRSVFYLVQVVVIRNRIFDSQFFCYYICNFAILSDFKSLCPSVCLCGLKSISKLWNNFYRYEKPWLFKFKGWTVRQSYDHEVDSIGFSYLLLLFHCSIIHKLFSSFLDFLLAWCKNESYNCYHCNLCNGIYTVLLSPC